MVQLFDLDRLWYVSCFTCVFGWVGDVMSDIGNVV